MNTRLAPSRRGFTLLELIVVIVILGILAALAIPTFQRTVDRSGVETTHATLAAIDRNARSLAAFDQEPVAFEHYEDAAGETQAAAVGTHAVALVAVLVDDDDAAGFGAEFGEVAVYFDGDVVTSAMLAPSQTPVFVSGPLTGMDAEKVTGDGPVGRADPRITNGATPVAPVTTTPTPTAEDWAPVAVAASETAAASDLSITADLDALVAAGEVIDTNGLTDTYLGRLVVYKAANSTAPPTLACRSGTPQPGVCNVYNAADIEQAPAEAAERAAALAEGRALNSSLVSFGCEPGSPDEHWCPVFRSAGDNLSVWLYTTQPGAQVPEVVEERHSTILTALSEPCPAVYPTGMTTGWTIAGPNSTPRTITGPRQYQVRFHSTQPWLDPITELTDGETYTRPGNLLRSRAPVVPPTGDGCGA